MRLVLALTAILAAAATASAAPKKGGLVRDNSKSISGGFGEVLPGTYTSTCYEPDPDCEPEGEYDYCDYLEVPCDQPCGYKSYNFNGYTMEDGSREIYVDAYYDSNCILDDNGYVSYYCSAVVSVPPATWTQKLKSAKIKFSATLGNCNSYAYDDEYNEVAAPEPNPLEGTKLALDASLACKTLDRSKYKCHSSSTYGGERSKNIYGSTDSSCYLENVPGLKVNGMSRRLDYASFGTYKYFDKYMNLKPKRKGPK